MAIKRWLTWIWPSFFDHVHHQRLLARIATRVTDQRIIRQIRLTLTARVVMPDGTKVAVREGTPQGGPLSPCLSNIVLDELDQELARRGLRFVRYADDVNIFVRSERAGLRVMTSVRTFLGFSFRCTKEDQGDTVAVFPSREAKRRLMTTIREKTPPNWGRSITSCMEGRSRYLNGWMSHFRICTPEAVTGLSAIDAHARRRIRAIIVRQKKRSRFLFRHLISKGSSRKAAAGCAYCGKGAWFKSNRYAMTRTYPNAWFKGRVASLTARWHDLNHPLASDQLELAL